MTEGGDETPQASFDEKQTNNSTPKSLKSKVFGPHPDLQMPAPSHRINLPYLHFNKAYKTPGKMFVHKTSSSQVKTSLLPPMSKKQKALNKKETNYKLRLSATTTKIRKLDRKLNSQKNLLLKLQKKLAIENSETLNLQECTFSLTPLVLVSWFSRVLAVCRVTHKYLCRPSFTDQTPAGHWDAQWR